MSCPGERLVLGIDPGTAIMGYGLVAERAGILEVVDYGVITTQPDRPLHFRLKLIYEGLTEIIARYRPTEAAVEELFFSRNVRTAFAVGQARGVALLCLAMAGLDVGEYSPQVVKQAVAVYGRARKDQVQMMVRVLLNLPEIPEPDDAADALAIAITHIHFGNTARLIEEAQSGIIRPKKPIVRSTSLTVKPQ